VILSKKTGLSVLKRTYQWRLFILITEETFTYCTQIKKSLPKFLTEENLLHISRTEAVIT